MHTMDQQDSTTTATRATAAAAGGDGEDLGFPAPVSGRALREFLADDMSPRRRSAGRRW